MKLAAILLAVLVSTTGIARADDDLPQDQTRPQRGQPMQKLRRALVEQFDRDGDGRLDRRERRQASRVLRRMAKRMGERGGARGGDRRARLIQKYDLDQDGNLDPSELPPRVQKRLRRLDRNGDGWLDQNDRAAPADQPR